MKQRVIEYFPVMPKPQGAAAAGRGRPERERRADRKMYGCSYRGGGENTL